MKLLVWTFSLCLIANGVSGLFLDEISQFFGGKTDKAPPAGMNPVNSNASTIGFLDEMEHAADSLNDLYQQFRKVT